MLSFRANSSAPRAQGPAPATPMHTAVQCAWCSSARCTGRCTQGGCIAQVLFPVVVPWIHHLFPFQRGTGLACLCSPVPRSVRIYGPGLSSRYRAQLGRERASPMRLALDVFSCEVVGTWAVLCLACVKTCLSCDGCLPASLGSSCQYCQSVSPWRPSAQRVGHCPRAIRSLCYCASV